MRDRYYTMIKRMVIPGDSWELEFRNNREEALDALIQAMRSWRCWAGAVLCVEHCGAVKVVEHYQRGSCVGVAAVVEDDFITSDCYRLLGTPGIINANTSWPVKYGRLDKDAWAAKVAAESADAKQEAIDQQRASDDGMPLAELIEGRIGATVVLPYAWVAADGPGYQDLGGEG